MSGGVLVLGAGPAGLWAAMRLRRDHPDIELTVVERERDVGGITGSFSRAGLSYDYGSHRLHPVTPPEIMESVTDLLGDSLLRRPRHGRILLEGRFLAFPLEPLDLIRRLPLSFSLGVALDGASSPLRRRPGEGADFASVLRAGLGSTVSERFYFPYAEKLWGLPPGELDGVQARRRVAAGSLGRMVRKALSSLRGGGGRSESGVFYYPEGGFGSICEAAAERLATSGVRLMTGAEAVRVRPPGDRRDGEVDVLSGGRRETFGTDFVLSSIPVTSLVEMLDPPAPGSVLDAAAGLRFRSMVFLYLELETGRYTEYDAHYFPQADICFSRMSEPRNYSGAESPPDRTGLCFELPCWSDDAVYGMADGEVADMVLRDLRRTGLPEPTVADVFTRRKARVYPSYQRGFSRLLADVEDYVTGLDGIATFGRQGLFAHDNTHHSMETGFAAASCLDRDLGWNSERWASLRRRFEEHVVVD